MKKVITMIMMIMLAMSMMIPNCAFAQSYEEAEKNDIILEALLFEDFRYDIDTGLWVLESVDEDSNGREEYRAKYDLYYNTGNIEFKYYSYDENGIESLSAEGNCEFKWFQENEEFGLVSINLKGYEWIGDMNFPF